MKVFVCFALIALAVVAVAAGPVSANINQEIEGQEANAADLTRLRKSAGYGGGSPASSGGYGGGSSASSGGYGGGSASIPAPPCPKNYLFSCQPNLAPVPCSAPQQASYGSQGAYSAPVPTYVNPLSGNYGLPQGYGAYLPQGVGYNNQYYQY